MWLKVLIAGKDVDWVLYLHWV